MKKGIQDNWLEAAQKKVKDDNLTYAGIAKIAKISSSYVSDIFNGKKNPSKETILRVKSAIGILPKREIGEHRRIGSYHLNGSKAVLEKVSINGIVPANVNSLFNKDVPDLRIFAKCSAKIMRFITKKPLIDTEYYKSSELVEIQNYEDDPYLKHSFIIVQNNRYKAIVTIDLARVIIVYARKQKIVLEFNNRLDAKSYWKSLQPERDITNLTKEYLKELGNKQFKYSLSIHQTI